VEAPRFATVVGLAKYGGSRIALGAASSARRMRMSGVEGMIQRIKFYLQDFW